MFAPPTVDMSSQNSFAVALSGTCDDKFMQLYSQTYHSFLTKNCGSCHTSGPGIGQFGSQSLGSSFDSFMSITRDKIHRQALNPGHQSPITGAHNSVILDPFIPYWENLENECAIDSSQSGLYIESTGKVDALIATKTNVNNTWQKKEWDLSTELKDSSLVGKFSLFFSIDIRTYMQSGVAVGYQFRNPSFRLKASNSGVHEVKGIVLAINDKQLSDLSTYEFVNVVVNSTTTINAAPGYAYPLAILPTATTDKFSVGFSEITVNGVVYKGTSSSSTTTPPTTTTPPATVPTVVTFTNLISTDATLGVFKKSCTGCHGGTSASAGLDLTNYTQASAKAASILSRMNDTAKPMPTSGLLPPSQRDLVNNWIQNGKPQ